MCLNCFVAFEAELKRNGLYDNYVKQIKKGNIAKFAKDLEEWANESFEYENTYVTEQGDIETWDNNNQAVKTKLTKEIKEYLKYLRSKLD